MKKELFVILKAVRNRLAHEENLPAYIIFSDSTLLDMATYLPLSQDDLLEIPGMGKMKYEKYGGLFLEAIREYCVAHKYGTRIALRQPKKEKRRGLSVKDDQVGATYRISYNLYRQGKTISEISRERNFSVQTIEGHLSHFIQAGDLPVHELVDAQKRTAIENVARLYGTRSLKTLKDNLPEDITYGEIRMMLASLHDL